MKPVLAYHCVLCGITTVVGGSDTTVNETSCDNCGGTDVETIVGTVVTGSIQEDYVCDQIKKIGRTDHLVTPTKS